MSALQPQRCPSSLLFPRHGPRRPTSSALWCRWWGPSSTSPSEIMEHLSGDRQIDWTQVMPANYQQRFGQEKDPKPSLLYLLAIKLLDPKILHCAATELCDSGPGPTWRPNPLLSPQFIRGCMSSQLDGSQVLTNMQTSNSWCYKAELTGHLQNFDAVWSSSGPVFR